MRAGFQISWSAEGSSSPTTFKTNDPLKTQRWSCQLTSLCQLWEIKAEKPDFFFITLCVLTNTWDPFVHQPFSHVISNHFSSSALLLFSNVTEVTIRSSQTPTWVCFHTNVNADCVTALQISETKSNIDRKRAAGTGSQFMCLLEQIYCLGSGFVKSSHSAQHSQLLIRTPLIDWDIRQSWVLLCAIRLSLKFFLARKHFKIYAHLQLILIIYSALFTLLHASAFYFTFFLVKHSRLALWFAWKVWFDFGFKFTLEEASWLMDCPKFFLQLQHVTFSVRKVFSLTPCLSNCCHGDRITCASHHREPLRYDTQNTAASSIRHIRGVVRSSCIACAIAARLAASLEQNILPVLRWAFDVRWVALRRVTCFSDCIKLLLPPSNTWVRSGIVWNDVK